MLIVTDIYGNTEGITGYKTLKRYRNVNGEKTLSFLLLPTEQNAHSFPLVQEESLIEFDGELYRIKQMNEKPRGKSKVKEVIAIRKLFDLINSYKYETHTGSLTFQAALQFVFEGTGYTWSIVDSFLARTWENFGDDNKIALFQEILNRYGAEYTLNDQYFTFKKKIGNATDFQFRYNYNVKTLNRSVKTNNLSTYIKGFGKDGLTTEYISPNAAKFVNEFSTDGYYHAKPVRDERYTTQEGLLERLKEEIKDEPELSITIDFADMRRAGFPYDVPNEGDDVFLIYEPLELDVEARIIEVDEEFIEGQTYPIRTNVTLANFRNSFVREMVNFKKTKKQVDGIFDGSAKIPYNVLDEAVRIATEALQSAQTELEFENGIIARSKDDPNMLVLFNSAGFGISSDGGQTFREAITGDGFVLSAGAIGQLKANNIQIGPETSFEDGYDPTKMLIGGKNLIKNGNPTPDQPGLEAWSVWGVNTDLITYPMTDETYKGGGLRILENGTDVTVPVGAKSPNFYIRAGMKYTLSFVVGSAGYQYDLNYNFILYPNSDNQRLANVNIQDYPVYDNTRLPTNTDFNTHKVTITFTATATSDEAQLLLGFTPDDAPQTEGVWLRNIKLEVGDKATDWTPAPEDTDDKLSLVRDDLRLTAPLPTSLTLNQDGITASTDTIDKYARMDYRGFYAKKGAFAVERPDGYMLINDGIAEFDMAVQSGSPTYVDDMQYEDGTFAVTIQGPYARLASTSYKRFDYVSFKHTSRYLTIAFYGRSGGGGAYTYVQVRDENSNVLATNMTNSTGDTNMNVTIDLGVPTGQYRHFYIYFKTTDAAYPALLRMATKYLSG